MRDPELPELQRIVKAHLAECDLSEAEVDDLIRQFLSRRNDGKEQLATDQLLNALFMITRQRNWIGDEKET